MTPTEMIDIGEATQPVDVEERTGYDASSAVILAPTVLRAVDSERLRLGSLEDPKLRVREPFDVIIRKKGDSYVAVIEELGEFGEGATWGEALHDLIVVMRELAGTLHAERANLGPDLKRELTTLEAHVEFVGR